MEIPQAGKPGETYIPAEMHLTIGYDSLELEEGAGIRVPVLDARLPLSTLIAASPLIMRANQRDELPRVRLWDMRDGTWQLAIVFSAEIAAHERVDASSFRGIMLAPQLPAGAARMFMNGLVQSRTGKELLDEYHASEEILLIRFYEEGCEECLYETVADDISFAVFPPVN